ncbi:MAG: T9SS type A sorting domain-containing protein [Fibrobacteres bacterium]|nr:T9SS type A sorting domain-containing protein [Fibrobacterota bacterium]
MIKKDHSSKWLCVFLLSLFLADGILAARPTTEQIATRRANSVLAKVSDTLTPGTWGTLPVVPLVNHSYLYNGVNYTLGLLTSPPPSTGFDILGWCDDSHWDSVTGQYFHMGLRKTRKFIVYSEETNTWRVIDLSQNPDSAQSPHIAAYWGHVYGNNAFDIENSRFYHHAHGSDALPNGIDSGTSYPGRICYFDVFTEKWTRLSSNPISNKESSIEYFSAMKGLVCLSEGTNGGRLDFYSDSTKSWRVLANGLYVGGYHTLGRHNPFKEEILFVGGNDQPQGVVRLKKDGTVERLADLPIPIGMSSDKITVDPVTGRYLIRIEIATGVQRFFEFNSDKNIYKEIPHPPTRKNGGIWGPYDMPTCAFIPEYKVTLWTYGNTMYVYKHDTLKAVSLETNRTSSLTATSLSISPNPSNGFVKFSIPNPSKNVSLAIFSVDGKLIETINFNKTIQNHVNRKFSNGVYFAQLKTDDITRKGVRFIVLN